MKGHHAKPTDELEAFVINEREVTEEYLRLNDIEQTLNEVLNIVVTKRCEDPYSDLAKLLDAKSIAQRRISVLKLIDSMSCEGHSATTVRLQTGKLTVNATMSTLEAWCNVPDEEIDPKERTSTEEIQLVLEQKLVHNDIEVTEQMRIDSTLQSIVPIIGNATSLATSLAICEAGAKIAGTELVHYIASLAGTPIEHLRIPIPIFSLLEDTTFSTLTQEVFVIPRNVISIQRALRLGFTMMLALTQQLEEGKVSSIKSNIACRALSFQDLKFVECLTSAVQSQTVSADQQFERESYDIGMNIFRKSNKGQTEVGGLEDDQIDKIIEMIDSVPLHSFIYPFDAMDMPAFGTLEDKLKGSKLAQNDPSSTFIARRIKFDSMQKLDESILPTAFVLSLGRYATLSEFIQCIRYAHQMGCSIVMETTSAESLLPPEMLASLAVGLGVEYVKFGGWSQTESILRYNSLLAIADDFLDKDHNMHSKPLAPHKR
uniref:phosphopyruvate hydratase n=1 Tax=Albugo laibachii Nc14 TaxID=890382 RepID=F0W5Q5_9STRA|nr:enolaselike protein putative [Albugo laibachii Nc14]|eukprot:CCA16446.1 enolaselike protein putative [Albugo laibachii Nc14]